MFLLQNKNIPTSPPLLSSSSHTSPNFCFIARPQFHSASSSSTPFSPKNKTKIEPFVHLFPAFFLPQNTPPNSIKLSLAPLSTPPTIYKLINGLYRLHSVVWILIFILIPLYICKLVSSKTNLIYVSQCFTIYQSFKQICHKYIFCFLVEIQSSFCEFPIFSSLAIAVTGNAHKQANNKTNTKS